MPMYWVPTYVYQTYNTQYIHLIKMVSYTTPSRMSQLADVISRSVANMNEMLSALQVAQPSFSEDAFVSLPNEVSDDKDAILDAAAELYDLLLDPLELLYRHVGHNNPVSLQAIARFNIASMVPLGGQATFAEISSQTGLDERHVRRLLRHATTMRVFCEPQPGVITHTKASKMLASSEGNDWLRVGTEEMWPAATKMVDALQTWPGSCHPNETAFALANDTEHSIYEILGNDVERANRFANSMKVFVTRLDYNPTYITDHYDWAALGRAQVVDIGGGRGHIAKCLARCFDNLNIIVQDMEKVIQDTELEEDIRGRVRFVAHDLFAPQTIQADVFFLRWVLHNWPDSYCIMILRALIPVLRPGVKIIIQETMMPEPGSVALWREKYLRAEDLNMGAIFNSEERTIGQWKVLLGAADPRFVVNAIIEPKGSALGILEVFWKSL
ncbi:S-adenosyl-L-methionine-dependent methyltransferase [Hypoxylon sp. NC1633]|nr:S-adenosyl-L-methionine-dependent methyltransferase [Hypoxylon sp. NC1633]